MWSSQCGSAVTNLTSIHEDEGSIPGLAQRVKDLALLWLWGRMTSVALMRPLAWEPPYAAGAALKKRQKKKKKRRIYWSFERLHEALCKHISETHLSFWLPLPSVFYSGRFSSLSVCFLKGEQLPWLASEARHPSAASCPLWPGRPVNQCSFSVRYRMLMMKRENPAAIAKLNHLSEELRMACCLDLCGKVI